MPIGKGEMKMNEIQRYLAEEHVEDYQDGLITRRELLRRVTLIAGSAAAATAFLAACGSGPSGVASPTPTAPAAATVAPRGSLPAVAYATPPAQPTTDGVTVPEDDARIDAGPLTIKAADGVDLIAYQAGPKTRGAAIPGILVIHENRGLVPHIKDVTRRVATAGYFAIAIDLVSREGGTDRLADPGAVNQALSRRPVADMVKDLTSTLEFLRRQSLVNGAKLGVTGFCFGGGMTWSLLAAGGDVQAAVPFYGPVPAGVSGLGSTKAAVLAVYAQNDTRVTSGKDAIEQQLKRAGVPYAINIYPGVDHAFHNDTFPRYDADQARLAWVDTMEWFQRYLR